MFKNIGSPENAKSDNFQVPRNGTSSARIQKRRPTKIMELAFKRLPLLDGF